MSLGVSPAVKFFFAELWLPLIAACLIVAFFGLMWVMLPYGYDGGKK